MNHIKQLQLRSYRLLARTGLPAGFFRHLFHSCQLNTETRLGTVGDTNNCLTQYLRSFGLAIQKCDDAAFPVSLASRFGTRNTDDFQPFDIILQCVESTKTGALFERASVVQTAQLLSELQPNGQLVYLILPAATATDSTPQIGHHHSTDCYLQYLNCFPGNAVKKLYRPSRLRSLANRWLLGHQMQTVETVTIHKPERAILPRQWERIVDNIVTQYSATGCESQFTEPPVVPLRKAA